MSVASGLPGFPLPSERARDDGVFTFTRSGGDVSQPLTVQFQVLGSATNGVDYDTIPNNVTIPAGATLTNLPIRVRPDDLLEVSEVAIVSLSPGPGYVVGTQSRASMIIQDDYSTIRDYTEPNETLSFAKPLGDETPEGYKQVTAAGYREAGFSIDQPGDLDHFSYLDSAGDVPMAVMIEFDHTEGDLSLAVFNDRGQELARSTGTGDVERVVLPPSPGKTYYLRVWGEGDATNRAYAVDIRPVRSGPALHLATPVSTYNFNKIYMPVTKPGKESRVTATLVNVGDQPLDMGAIDLPAGYTVIGTASARLEAGESETVTFVSAPGAAPGVRDSAITIPTNEPGGGQVIHLVAPTSGVTARRFLYNNSNLDGNTPQFGTRDSGAIDSAKTALLPGQTATADNVSNYPKGINGVVLTMVRPSNLALTPDDFDLRFSGPDGTTWTPSPDSVNVLSAPAGAFTYNVSLIWPDYDPANPQAPGHPVADGWLEVSMKPNERTGLEAPDVSYFGNLIGDTGDGATHLAVNALDLAAVRAHLGASNDTWRYDFNRDRIVNAFDLALVRANLSHRLQVITAPSLDSALFSATPVAARQHDNLASLLA